ncbi:sodium-translocating pyrophosphatase [Patescibacteria group bacterium]|nr:sodium-translocating pyrophosphatase [Patescibacteria group bacterium]
MVLIITSISGLISILVAIYLFFYIVRQERGTKKMIEISEAIKEGAHAYLKRQNKTLAIFVLIMAILLGVLLDFEVALAYIFGTICTAIASFFGMAAAINANVRTTQAAKKGLDDAFKVAFYGGAITGLSIVGMALLGISILYSIFGPERLDIILGFSFGASALALFAKAGGGVYTKTADIGADLVGKVELGIPEDDPRNPAVIADNVGDNVGDVAGMGADLIDSYIACMIAAMILGRALGINFILLPLLIGAVGIFSSLIGMFFVKTKKQNPGRALNKGTFSTCFFFAILTFFLIYFLGFGNVGLKIFFAILSGLIAGIIIGITTNYFTSIDKKPVLKTAEAAKTGAAINILSGFSYGLISVLPPVIGICTAILISFHLVGIYGISISAVGMLSIVGMIISADAYGPIVDNAKGIAEQSGLGEKVIKITDRLDAAGNTSKAITKGFAIGAAALTVLSLFAAYSELIGIESLDLMKPDVMVGVFIGAITPPFLSALLILAVQRNAGRMITEVRRQFKEIPGLMKGKTKPDYAKCVDIATKGALKELILPCLLTIIFPLAVGFLLGKHALGGFLGGSIFTGIIFALLMANAGGAWDNAKKYIEKGNLGGKGSEVHKAAMIGDLVGDPFKDTAGPTINTLITVMSLVATIFAPLIIKYALF